MRRRTATVLEKVRPTVERMMFTSGTSNEGALKRSVWRATGGVQASPVDVTVDFPTLQTNNAHMQRVTTDDTSFVLVNNDDTSKRILLESFAVMGQNPASVTNPKSLIGTVAQEGETDDLFVWMIAYISGHWEMNSPILLDPGKDLIHYNVKGPGQNNWGQPCFFKVSYSIVDA